MAQYGPRFPLVTKADESFHMRWGNFHVGQILKAHLSQSPSPSLCCHAKKWPKNRARRDNRASELYCADGSFNRAASVLKMLAACMSLSALHRRN
jgi:hypothetical protein